MIIPITKRYIVSGVLGDIALNAIVRLSLLLLRGYGSGGLH